MIGTDPRVTKILAGSVNFVIMKAIAKVPTEKQKTVKINHTKNGVTSANPVKNN